MAQLDALKLADSLQQRMVNFALDDNFVRDGKLAETCRSIWDGPPDRGGLISDLWVEGAFPSKSSQYCLDDLVDLGKFDGELRDVLDASGAMPRDRKLYTHQFETIEKSRTGDGDERPAVVVTAGTGSGKTEAFLLPILDDLYRNPASDVPGAKCIILYPMNALVNDQVDRLYEWMKDQDRVTLFHFTSETPEDRRMADVQGVPNLESCRMWTRQQARGLEDRFGRSTDPATPGPTPDIVITNYSMLEYMLCRPQDAVFFGPALRTIVLDEAHLYTGTLAAEITLLLRRLLLRCEVDPRRILQMATSATLGTGDEDKLRGFVSQLFSKPSSMVHAIEGELTRADLDYIEPPSDNPTAETVARIDWLHGPTVVEHADRSHELAPADKDVCEELRQRLTSIVSGAFIAGLDPNEFRPAMILYETLGKSPLIHRLQEVLWNRKHIPLDELGFELFGAHSENATNAAAALLHLAASARNSPKSHPLVPHRLHVLTRPTDGLTVCMNENCTGPPARRIENIGAVSAGYQEICEYCQFTTLSLYRCENCGEWLLAGRQMHGKLKAETHRNPETQLLSIARSSTSWDTVYVDPSTGDICGSTAVGAIPLVNHTLCPNCEDNRARIRPFSSGTPLTLSIVTETLLSEMPEFPAPNLGSNAWLPARGRRLLAFSDSRREAARLGILLTNQHEQQLVRSAILNLVEDSPIQDDGALRRIQRRIRQNEEDLNSPDLSPGERRIIEIELDGYREQFTSLTAGGSVEDWANQLSESKVLTELLDRPSSGNHTSEKWTQIRWEENASAVKERAKQLLAAEFATSFNRDTTLEALGLVEVTYPGLDDLTCPNQLLGALPTESMREALRLNWSEFLASLCDTLRVSRAITLGEELDSTYDFDGIPIGLWASANRSDGPRLTNFVGRNDRQLRLRFAIEVLRRCGFTDSSLIQPKAQDILQACFMQLFEASRSGNLKWVEVSSREVYGGGSVDAIRLVFDHLALRRSNSLYRCKRTGRVWHRSVMSCAPNVGSFGTLESVTPEQLNDDPRIGRRRKEYRESGIFKMGLWSEEHSAQLDPKENRRLQDLFKSGIRNILSATTTLELGIDIGGLNGVLMSNVPPGKSNYLQRAGRAGRRADGSSIVTTFARPRPFDREVFGRVGDYLAQPLREPMVFLDRERVVLRHLNSFLLNEFFSPQTSDIKTGAMDAFRTMGDICGVPKAPRWSRGDKKPELYPGRNPSISDAFLSFLNRVKSDGEPFYKQSVEAILHGTPIRDKATSDWRGLIQQGVDQFSEAVNNWQDEYNLLVTAWRDSTDRRQVGALGYQMRALYEVTVIEALADRQFLPHYGFPIGVQKLRVIAPDDNRRSRIREEDQYRLQRDSLLALREYVPGSKLLAGGKLVTSHGLLKHWTGVELDNYIGIRGRYTWCINDHFYYWNTPDTEETCPICGGAAKMNPRQFMFPRHGFSGAAWDPPKWSTNIEFVGEPETAARTFTYESGEDGNYTTENDFGGIRGLSAYYKEDGELLVYNEGQKGCGFAICLQCGYADSEYEYGEGRMKLPRGFEYHAPLNSPNIRHICWSLNAAPVIRNEALAAREVTDVLLIDFAMCLGTDMKNVALVTTLGYALQRAATRMLQLDGREIGVLTAPGGPSGQGLGSLLYDNVPGGAGHVRELLALGRDWLEEARRVLKGDDDHDLRCKSACLDCLLSFDTQSASFHGLLDRPRALEELASLLDGASTASEKAINVQDHAATKPTQNVQRLSNEERLRRARNRSKSKRN